MWALLRNTKVTSAVGFTVVIALIWLVGPFVGLNSREDRLIWIIGVMLVLVVGLLVGRIISERAGSLLEKVLRRQTDEAVMAASADQRRDVAQLRQRLLAAIDTLKTSRLGKVRGKAALYELPWYLIIGHPAAGKSSAILYSGLDFPFGDKQAVQGVGGTRNCDWFFTTDGVLLDTAGRYSTQREDRPEWLEFLKLLKKYRAKAPANGILVAISFPELVPHKSEQFTLYARQVRERINEIDDAFGIKVPIYLLFTKIDLLGGFSQFFEDLSEEERQGVWGATLSHDQGAGFDAPRVVGQQFDGLRQGLMQMGLDKLAKNGGNVKRPALFAFPIEFNGMREAVCKFVELLFQDDPYHSKPLLRGFYFTSALQEGSPVLRAGNRVARVFDLAQPGSDAVQSPASNSFFLHRLFKDVIFPDRHLITRQVKPASSGLRLAALLAGLSCLALLAGGLTWSFIGNEKLIANAGEELQVARTLAESADLSDRLKGLQVLQLRIEQLYRYRREGYPIQLGMGLYRGDRVEKTLRAEYFSGVRELMLTPVKASLEIALADLRELAPAAPPAVAKPAAPAPVVVPRPAPKPPAALPIIPIGYHGVGGRLAPLPLVSNAVYRPRDGVFFSRVQARIPPAASATPIGRAHNGGGTAPPRAAHHLEDGYNALKTYLMLEQQERMEISHLSDQLPKYWRPWLNANRGKGNPDEINRLAERTVAFYVSQFDATDLPLIQTRQDLVGQSRELLRGAFRRLSAAERVFNELKARANTQFAPMTVGRILNSRDLDVLAGSSTLPGAFTREAWDGYFRTAITEASKGEIRGDDWVLATTALENLGKDGNVERNRQDLENLYKTEYAREWTKFIQGIAIADFSSIDSATQSLSKLSDAQNSPLKLIIVKAAYETAWDNPSPISTSIDTARSSVIARTEKLVLGNNAPPSGPAVKLGEIGAKFALLSALTLTAEGGRMPLSAYLDMLSKLKSKLAQIAAHPEPGTPARLLMQATLAASGSEFADALALIDGVLLANASNEAKDVVRPLLVRPLVQAYATLIPHVELDLNRSWQAEVMSPWRQLAGKYPFADTSNEASMADIARFLKPGEGVLPRFVDKHLNGLVSKRGEHLVPRTWANLGVSLHPGFTAGVARLTGAGNAVLQEGEATRFELQPVPTPGLSEIVIEVDGQVLRYRNGPQSWTGFTWPNAPANGAPGARIQVVSFSGASTSVAHHTGRLGLVRLLASATVDEARGDTAQLSWRLAANDARDGFARADDDSVRFNFRLVSGANPLSLPSLSALRSLSLPEKVTNRGG